MFFFFSSRRRHTRCSRDWSSDVCSSDLCHRLELLLLHPRPVGELRRVLPRPRLYSRALRVGAARLPRGGGALPLGAAGARGLRPEPRARIDRKSTRLNSSHGYISYAVFCLKKKKKN